MVSLYKRANDRQRRILRIVEGAVKNVADHHGHEFSPRLARSIAKRAAGTLTAQWPDTLAAPLAPSDKLGNGQLAALAGPSASDPNMGLKNGQGNSYVISRPKRGGHRLHGRSATLPKIIKAISMKIGELKRRGSLAEADGMIEAMRIIHRLTSQD